MTSGVSPSGPRVPDSTAPALDRTEPGRAPPAAVDPALWRAFQNSSGLLATLPVAVYVCDRDDRVVWANDKAARLWGRLPGLAIDRGPRGVQVYDPDGNRITPGSGPMSRVLATGIPISEQEAVLVRPDGTEVPVLANLMPLFDEDGRVIGGVNCFTDISEIKKAQARLQERETRERAMLEALPVAVFMCDAEGRLTFYNDAAVRLWGLRPALHDRTWGEPLRLFRADGAPLRPDDWPLHRAIRENRPVEGEEGILLRPDGSSVPYRSFPAPIHDDAGAVVGAVVTVFDLSDRKRAEAQQKVMLDELNHRVKNTLATVQSLATQSFKGAAPEMREAFEGRLFALSRTHNQLTLSNWAAADMGTLVHDVLEPFGDADGKRIAIAGEQVTLVPRTALVLSMMLHELATNAAKYGALSSGGGRLDIGWGAIGGGVERRLRLTWRESGGPPVQKPTRRGFGSRLIEHGARGDLKGTATIDFDSAGVRCTLDIAAPGPT